MEFDLYSGGFESRQCVGRMLYEFQAARPNDMAVVVNGLRKELTFFSSSLTPASYSNRNTRRAFLMRWLVIVLYIVYYAIFD